MCMQRRERWVREDGREGESVEEDIDAGNLVYLPITSSVGVDPRL